MGWCEGPRVGRDCKRKRGTTLAPEIAVSLAESGVSEGGAKTLPMLKKELQCNIARAANARHLIRLCNLYSLRN